MLELRTHGRGGQGVVTFGDMLAQTALEAGSDVQTLPFFGVERRGASVRATLRIAKEPIKKRSMCYNPDILVLFNANQLEEALAIGNTDNAVLVINDKKEPEPDIKRSYWLLDAESIAARYNLFKGDTIFINVIMVGALVKVLDLPVEAMVKSIMENRGVKESDPNIRAALYAYNTIREFRRDER